MARALATFLITVGVAAPALLDANIEKDGKKLRPHQQTFTIDGTKVTLDVDRALVTTGDKVTATLTAYSDTPKQVALDLRLMQTHLQLGERVEPPTHQIDREKVTIDATPDGGTAKVSLVLGKARKSLAQLDRFEIMVAPHGTPSPMKHDVDGDADSGRDLWDADIEAGTAAQQSVLGWSGNSISMKTAVEGPIVAGQPFVVAVKVKNTTGKVLPATPQIELATTAETQLKEDSDVAIEEIDDADAPGELERGGETVRKFKVTPASPMKQITLAVTATAFADDIGPILGGARDVVTFRPSEAGTKVASK
jgi:hypothetical protein